MKVVVCLKQVPDTAEVKIDRATNTLIREGVPSIINPFDRYALEEAVRIKERLGASVTVLSMGPDQVKEALREALSLGADEAILLSDRAFAGADTLATSYSLARGIEKIGGYDLILFGKQAIDGDTGQVGPGVAEVLGLPHITLVRRLVDLREGQVKVERLVEGGWELLATALPAVFTVVKEINEPRVPSIKGMLRAKRAEIPVWRAADLQADPRRTGLAGSPTRVAKIYTPVFDRQAEVLSGTAGEQAQALVARLRENKII
ncbi:MAG: electron transfer flavoprotein subunit beta/FixA family protein [Firmicutes bacterium]|nr:electron transfer flavoprotein subunit beta/FixA family protein [Bacillota bacterium]MCL5040371.1 electron transfer flavoprotein subunit beta/FixA family protein [Bacillota bacterium]